MLQILAHLLSKTFVLLTSFLIVMEFVLAIEDLAQIWERNIDGHAPQNIEGWKHIVPPQTQLAKPLSIVEDQKQARPGAQCHLTLAQSITAGHLLEITLQRQKPQTVK